MSQTAEPQETPEQKDARLGPCGVCGGKHSEHANRIHAFTAGTEMLTQAQQEKRDRQGQPVVLRATAPNGPTLVSRLIERLHDKGVFDDDDILFITGLKGGFDGAGS
jgi:hypothetical protein